MLILPYQYHLFFCLNTREDGRKACGSEDTLRMYQYAKQRVSALGLKPLVRVSQSGCLGHCQTGPSLVVYPQGVWYRVLTIEAVEEILQEHIIAGKTVEKYLMQEGV